VPALRAKYLQYVHQIAEESLRWEALGPVVGRYVALIDQEVAADTRKLSSYQAFREAVSDASPPGTSKGHPTSIRAFVEQRRAFLLRHASEPQVHVEAIPVQ